MLCDADCEANVNSIYNLKRRIELLPALSEGDFQEHSRQSPASRTSDTEAAPPFERTCDPCEQHYTSRRAWQAHRKSRNHVRKSADYQSSTPVVTSLDSDDQSSDEEEEAFRPQQCLFCDVDSPSLDSNLSHMSAAHGFFIPNTARLVDTESFLSYLFAIVSVFHECFFCGSVKNTKLAVRDHMRGKGHCKLNIEHDEHQLSQFYDFSVDEAEERGENSGEGIAPVLDKGERLLPSGKIVRHRSSNHSPHHKHPSYGQSISQRQHNTVGTAGELATTTPTIPILSPERTVAMRAGTSTSLIGLSEFQKRALMAVELKAEKMEARARNEYHSKAERVGNKQKTFRVKSIGKKAGGLEKRLG